MGKRRTPLEEVIAAVGSQAALAQRLSRLMRRPVSQQAVSKWLRSPRRSPPAEYCLALEAIAEGAVKASELRPDVFGRDYSEARRTAS